ncbi:helix-turn-helix domain-containing protein, partial [Neisseria dentiae]
MPSRTPLPRTAEHFNVSRTHLRRWIAAYRQGGIA